VSIDFVTSIAEMARATNARLNNRPGHSLADWFLNRFGRHGCFRLPRRSIGIKSTLEFLPQLLYSFILGPDYSAEGAVQFLEIVLAGFGVSAAEDQLEIPIQRQELVQTTNPQLIASMARSFGKPRFQVARQGLGLDAVGDRPQIQPLAPEIGPRDENEQARLGKELHVVDHADHQVGFHGDRPIPSAQALESPTIVKPKTFIPESLVGLLLPRQLTTQRPGEVSRKPTQAPNC
jgi:hypothetical protein